MSFQTILVNTWRRFFAPSACFASQRLRIFNRTRNTELAHDGELAGTGASRRKGLLGRDELPAGHALWIRPCEAVHTFGMRFAIDIVYLNKKHRVVKTRAMMRQRRISACLTAHSVIELPAGMLERTHTQKGDVLEIERL